MRALYAGFPSLRCGQISHPPTVSARLDAHGRSPYPFYLIHITLCAVVLSVGWTTLVAALSFGGFGVLFLLPGAGQHAHPADPASGYICKGFLGHMAARATQSTEEIGPIRIELGHCGADTHIAVEDHGTGIPEAVLPRVGKPFFTTRQPGRGLGLGVFLVRAVESHGGELSIESKSGVGTRARMRIPMPHCRATPGRPEHPVPHDTPQHEPAHRRRR